MIDLPFGHFMLVALVALVVIGPKDLPKAMRVLGYWVGKARGVARQFRSGFDEMVREAELAELEKKWAAENERIMREHPAGSPAGGEVAAAASSDGVTSHVTSYANGAADGHGEPIMVERPHVEPAPAGTPPPRGDGVTS